MLLWPQTGELTRVEAAPPGARPLAWSDDHNRLLFSSSHRGGREQLYEYQLETEVLRTVTRGSFEHPRVATMTHEIGSPFCGSREKNEPRRRPTDNSLCRSGGGSQPEPWGGCAARNASNHPKWGEARLRTGSRSPARTDRIPL